MAGRAGRRTSDERCDEVCAIAVACCRHCCRSNPSPAPARSCTAPHAVARPVLTADAHHHLGQAVVQAGERGRGRVAAHARCRCRCRKGVGGHAVQPHLVLHDGRERAALRHCRTTRHLRVCLRVRAHGGCPAVSGWQPRATFSHKAPSCRPAPLRALRRSSEALGRCQPRVGQDRLRHSAASSRAPAPLLQTPHRFAKSCRKTAIESPNSIIRGCWEFFAAFALRCFCVLSMSLDPGAA